jgi:hypothetical protein
VSAHEPERYYLENEADYRKVEVTTPDGAEYTIGIGTSPVDGAAYVWFETEDDTGRLRIDVNEGTVFDQDPEDEA